MNTNRANFQIFDRKKERAGISEGTQYFQVVSSLQRLAPTPVPFYSVYLPRVPAEMPIRRDSLPPIINMHY
jgi:hypothetical protein